MIVTNFAIYTVAVGRIAEAEAWMAEMGSLFNEITGKKVKILKEGWGDAYKMIFITEYENIGETEVVGEKVFSDKRVADGLEKGMKETQLFTNVENKFYTTIMES